MSKSIEHFIWGYQPNFRFGEELRANAIFQSLDDRFDPEIFVVGIRIQDSQDRYPACVEPEEDFWIKSEEFDGVIELSKSILQTYPEAKIHHSHTLAQQSHNQSLRRNAVRDAISQVILQCAFKPDKMRYFVSFPVELDGFLVSTVLGLQEEVLDSHPSLAIDRAMIHEYRSIKVSKSLIDAAVDEYLQDVSGELRKPDAGEGIGGGKSSSELLRAAGNRLLSGAAYKADASLDLAGYWQLLFDTCNRVSSLKYEQKVSNGRIVIARKKHPALETLIDFKDPSDVLDIRSLRKLLELSSSDAALHMNANKVFGLVKVNDYQSKTEDLYEINICAHHFWEFAHAGHTLMQVRAGLPSLSKPTFDSTRLQNDIKRVFPGVTTENIKLIISLVGEAEKEKRGTMLVISDQAANEAQRLQNQSTILKPCKLTADLLRHLTPIDGAVLIGVDGICYAIGVILDGIATDKGDSSRGARFNSAIRYVETHKENKQKSMAIVISEDGGIDIIPNLRPAIQKSIIEDKLIELKQILTADRVNRRIYNQIIGWLQENSFYLLKSHCESVSQLTAEIEDKIRKQDTDNPFIIQYHFKPHPEMDQDLYYMDE